MQQVTVASLLLEGVLGLNGSSEKQDLNLAVYQEKLKKLRQMHGLENKTKV